MHFQASPIWLDVFHLDGSPLLSIIRDKSRRRLANRSAESAVIDVGERPQHDRQVRSRFGFDPEVPVSVRPIGGLALMIVDQMDMDHSFRVDFPPQRTIAPCFMRVFPRVKLEPVSKPGFGAKISGKLNTTR